ncbi:D-mannose binding lectin [Frankineae bacterium MT45]|nr:D-mannose binding lectin [Frankineae bacterium MT45]
MSPVRIPLPSGMSARGRRRATGLLAVTVGCASLLMALAQAPNAKATVPGVLSMGSTLVAGQSITSASGTYTLIMQGDGNFVQYGPHGARWQSSTSGHPGARLVFQTDGNIVIYSTANRPLWYTSTNRAPIAARLVMQDDGNEVAYSAGGAPRWQSGTLAPPPNAGPFRAGNYVAQMQGDGNFVVTYQRSGSSDVIFQSGTGGHPNAYLAMQGDGNLVIYDGKRPLFSTRTSGNPGAHPVMLTNGNFAIYSAANQQLYSTGSSVLTAGIQPPPDSRFTLTWAHALGDAGPVALGSPGVGTLDASGPSVITGSRSGTLYAFHTGDGSRVAGWPVATGAAVDSTPSVSGSGSAAKIFVGLGTSAAPTVGGIRSYTANGAVRWSRGMAAKPTGAGTSGVQGSVGLGSLQSGLDAVAGSMNQEQYAVNGDTGANLRGFPWFEADSNFSTPSIAYISGVPYIIEGGDSTAGLAFGTQYPSGGHIRILAASGNGGNASRPGGGLRCAYDSDQVVQASPTIGNVLSGGRMGIFIGTGTFYPGRRDTNSVLAINTSCGREWQVALDGGTRATASLVDVQGNGSPLLIQPTFKAANSGSLYAINPANGAIVWHTALPGGMYGSATSIDLGNGYQSIIAATTGGTYIVDGRTGQITGTLNTSLGIQNTATVTRDPNGAIGVTVAGYNGYGRSIELHYELSGSNVSTVSGPGQWPVFKHDSQLTGVGS